MKVHLLPGRYVLAVSGGVDSMVLLDLLAGRPAIELVVAHFNHGIRPDSGRDEDLVARRAKQLGKPFEAGCGHLGRTANEDKARQARYRFLEQVRKKHRAKAIITAHHQDDLLETVMINTLRGTGTKGVTAMSTNQKIIRPLLAHSKKTILDYANANGLEWNEDSTNLSDVYLRNYLRLNVLSCLSAKQRRNLISNIDKVAKNQRKLNKEIAKVSQYVYRDSRVDRRRFICLPLDIENELLAFWLRSLEVPDLDRKAISRVNLALRTAKPGSVHPVKGAWSIKVGRSTARFIHSL